MRRRPHLYRCTFEQHGLGAIRPRRSHCTCIGPAPSVAPFPAARFLPHWACLREIRPTAGAGAKLCRGSCGRLAGDLIVVETGSIRIRGIATGAGMRTAWLCQLGLTVGFAAVPLLAGVSPASAQDRPQARPKIEITPRIPHTGEV